MERLELVHIKGMLEIFKQEIQYAFLYSHVNYYWKIMGSSEYVGPFDTIPLAVLNYEQHLSGISRIISGPNVIRVDFYNKKRAR